MKTLFTFVKFQKFFLLILLSILIFGCKKQKQKENWIFYHDFSLGHHRWQTVYTLLDQPLKSPEIRGCWQSWQNKFACTSFAPIIGGECVLSSPWWLDPNHAPPGAGYLNLLLYNYIDTIFPGNKAGIDLTGKTLYLELRSKSLELKQSKLLFWFQTKASNGKHINFAFTAAPIILDQNRTIVKLKLTNKPADWTCLGSSIDRANTYDCVSIAEAITNVNLDFGLVILPTSDDPNPVKQPQGQILVKTIGLY